MKKSTVNNILATLNVYHKELYHARALVRSIVYRTDVDDEKAAVNALIDAAEEVAEETQTNASEAPEMPLTASSDVQMSNVSTDAKEHGEDAKNAPETQLEHTDLLADDTARDLSKVA